MNQQQFHNNLRDIALPYSKELLAFLKADLKLGKKYVVLDIHTQNAQMSFLLDQQVHLICSLSTDPAFYQSLKQKYQNQANFISIHAQPTHTSIEDDSIDCIFIDETMLAYDSQKIKQEFERILRLNSYVLLTSNEYLTRSDNFSKAFDDWLNEQLAPNTNPSKLTTIELKEFYTNGFKQQFFQHQKAFSFNELLIYTRSFFEKKNHLWGPELDAQLQELFQQFSKNNKVILAYKTIVFFGLFNYSVPEISLRKSIFFNLLRPFAFGFYILVKSNIYFWKALFKIKNKVFGKKTKD
jgi:hypothetical protein